MPVSKITRDEEAAWAEKSAQLCKICGASWCNGDHDQDAPAPPALATPLLGREWVVTGSHGEKYTVRYHRRDGVWTCTCPAYGFGHGMECKHIVKVRAEESTCQ
jgi:hypothetical protein